MYCYTIVKIFLYNMLVFCTAHIPSLNLMHHITFYSVYFSCAQELPKFNDRLKHHETFIDSIKQVIADQTNNTIVFTSCEGREPVS